MSNLYNIVGVAREGLSQENPSANSQSGDLRVALNPSGVKDFCAANCIVLIEEGAGAGINYSDREFRQAGAKIVRKSTLYTDSDLVLKLKGPAQDYIGQMQSGALLACFAHLETFPERARIAAQNGIDILALEEIVDSPERIGAEISFAGGLADIALPKIVASTHKSLNQLEIVCCGFSDEIFAFGQHASRLGGRVTFVNQQAILQNEIGKLDERHVVIFNSESQHDLVSAFSSYQQEAAFNAIDLAQYSGQTDYYSNSYLDKFPPKEFGKRRVECLHETGICGARYGLNLLANISSLRLTASDASVVVLGYGNVAKGAIEEALKQGAKEVKVLGREQMKAKNINSFLKSADLIINGVDLRDKRGQVRVITNQHIKEGLVKQGAVIIDLVGGSKLEPSAIEGIKECTFLDDPFFINEGVIFSALWGWPMMYMMKESSDNYSRQITDIFCGKKDNLLAGFGRASEGIRKAFFPAQSSDFGTLSFNHETSSHSSELR